MAEEIKRPNYSCCDGFRLPACMSHEAFRSVLNYKAKKGELYIATYPKCGTTWMQSIVMLILRKGKPFENAMDYMINTPFIEFSGIDALDLMTGPGVIKTHLPFNLVPYSSEAKYIYVARNPKDCCVSFYHHTKMLGHYNFVDGTFDEYFELFVRGQTDFGDYFDHLLSWYEHKNDPNVYFTTYEELKINSRAEILKIAKFVGEDYYEALRNNPDIVENILKYSSISYMKKSMNEDINELFKNPVEKIQNVPVPSGIRYYQEYLEKHPNLLVKTDGNFIRKGIVGDWRNYFSPEQEKRMDERIKEKTSCSDVMNLWQK